MKVKDLIKVLQKMNPELPIERSASIESHRSVSICNGEDCSADIDEVGGKVLIQVGGDETEYY